MDEKENGSRELGPDDFPAASIVQVKGTDKRLRVLGHYINTGEILCTDKLDIKSALEGKEERHLARELMLVEKPE